MVHLFCGLIQTVPMSVMPNPANFTVHKDTIPAFGLPAVNTLILLISGVTVTFAHWALKKAQRNYLNIWLAVTVALGALFVYLQATEYHHAYTELSLKLSSGIYGSTFFLLTGFHGFHVFSGVLINILILIGAMKGTYHKRGHYEMVEKTGLYWHFVDLVWVFVFTFFYLV